MSDASNVKRIEVDIGAALAALQANPELGAMINEAIGNVAGRPKTLDEWSEETGDVVWWCWRDGAWLGEPAYIGTPLDLGQTVEIELRSNQGEFIHQHQVGGWPGYHTHWTPHPDLPEPPSIQAETEK